MKVFKSSIDWFSLCETLFQIFHFSSDGCLLSAQRCFDFHVLPILFKSQCWNISRVSVDYTCKCNAEISLWSSMSPLNSALLCFFRATYSVQVSIMKVFKSSIDYALRKVVSNLSLSFWWKSPVCTALLWFSRSSYFVQVSIMKVFKSSIDYALRNFVSNLSLFFWWKSPVCTALLWFSRSSYFVQVSMLKHFKSFGGLHLQM